MLMDGVKGRRVYKSCQPKANENYETSYVKCVGCVARVGDLTFSNYEWWAFVFYNLELFLSFETKMKLLLLLDYRYGTATLSLERVNSVDSVSIYIIYPCAAHLHIAYFFA